jgi:hypothetical protein
VRRLRRKSKVLVENLGFALGCPSAQSVAAGTSARVQRPVAAVHVQLREDAGERLIHHEKNFCTSALFPILIYRQVTVELVESVPWVGCGLDAILVAVHGAVKMVEKVEPFESTCGI